MLDMIERMLSAWRDRERGDGWERKRLCAVIALTDGGQEAGSGAAHMRRTEDPVAGRSGNRNAMADDGVVPPMQYPMADDGVVPRTHENGALSIEH